MVAVFTAPSYVPAAVSVPVLDTRSGSILRAAASRPAGPLALLGGSPTQRLPEVGPSDAAQIQYTSGTTGFPKGAVLHHRGITNNARFWAQRQGITAGDVLVNAMPLFHTAGCVMQTLAAVQAEATQ